MNKTFFILGAVGVAYNTDGTADMTLTVSETAPVAGPGGVPMPTPGALPIKFHKVSDAEIAAARVAGATVTAAFAIVVPAAAASPSAGTSSTPTAA